jgi:hypothetical protein
VVHNVFSQLKLRAPPKGGLDVAETELSKTCKQYCYLAD